jgi:crotonobetainyl-CoA:carnitine CoA-transferase CaiB-like acyl-CoA transferase
VIEHETAGSLRQIRNLARFSEIPTSLRRTPPGIGQHTEEVLQELGFDDAAIQGLREAKTVV